MRDHFAMIMRIIYGSPKNALKNKQIYALQKAMAIPFHSTPIEFKSNPFSTITQIETSNQRVYIISDIINNYFNSLKKINRISHFFSLQYYINSLREMFILKKFLPSQLSLFRSRSSSISNCSK